MTAADLATAPYAVVVSDERDTGPEAYADETAMLRYAITRVLNYGDEIPTHEVSAHDRDLILDHFDSGELRRQQRRAMRPLARFIVKCSVAQGDLATSLATVL